MTDVNVRLCGGTPEQYDIIADIKWPIVPRVGEEIVLNFLLAGQARFKVLLVDYAVGGDDNLIGARVYVTEVARLEDVRMRPDWPVVS